MRLILKLIAVAVLGTALGLLVTWLMLTSPLARGRISDGPWQTASAGANERGNPAMQAFVALHGLFALAPNEAVYYTATTDGTGAALDGRCRYTLTGAAPAAGWWSVTAYGPDDYLIANPAHRYSVTSAAAGARDASGHVAIQVGGGDGGDAWIPAAPGRFSLTLRLYNPSPIVRLNLAHAALPAVTKVGCP